MLEYSDVVKYDPSGMHKVYDDWPKIARQAYESDLEPANFEGINHIVFSGMGGSGAIGDLFLSVLSKTSIHVTIVKGYVLPKTADSNTLVIATSVSGNTVETLATVKSATELNCKLICFSSGGTLESFCKQHSIEHRRVQMYSNPRSSFPSYVFSILKVLNHSIPIDETSIRDAIVQMESLSEKISTKNLTYSNPAIDLAEWMDKIPIIYYPWGLQAAAIRFKNSIQENTKNHAIIEDVIEACHNGIVSWESSSNVQPILIEGEDDFVKTKERWKIIKDYFKINNIDCKEVVSIKGNILSKLVNLIYLLDFATIYRAIILKIDPSPVKSIDFVKNRLSL